MKKVWGVGEFADANEIDQDVLEAAIADGQLDVHRADGRRVLLSAEIDEDLVDELREASDGGGEGADGGGDDDDGDDGEDADGDDGEDADGDDGEDADGDDDHD